MCQVVALSNAARVEYSLTDEHSHRLRCNGLMEGGCEFFDREKCFVGAHIAHLMSLKLFDELLKLMPTTTERSLRILCWMVVFIAKTAPIFVYNSCYSQTLSGLRTSRQKKFGCHDVNPF